MLQLAEILNHHGIERKAIAAQVTLNGGNPMSPSTFSRLLNENYWPRQTPPNSIQAQVEKALRKAGVSEAELKTAWTVAPAQAAEESKQPGEDDMAKPILTQQARNAMGLKNGTVLFDNEVQSEDDLWFSEDMHVARAHIRAAALNGGFIAIVSEPGGGKTTLANDLQEYLLQRERDGGQAVRFIRPDPITVERLTAPGIYDAIIDDVSVGLPDKLRKPKRGLEQKSRQARQLLEESHKNNNRHVLIIEEAQGLHPSTLKSLKRFWELKLGHTNLLAIVLIGQTELGRLLEDGNASGAWNLREVSLRCQVVKVRALDAQEMANYLRHKFDRAGLDADKVFTPDAFQAMFERLQDGDFSLCYPQRINNLAMRALNKWAETGGLPAVTGEVVSGDLRLFGEG